MFAHSVFVQYVQTLHFNSNTKRAGVRPSYVLYLICLVTCKLNTS